MDFSRNENLLIVACSLAVGLGSASVPQVFDQLPDALKMFAQSGIVTGGLTAIFLNIFLNVRREKAMA